MMEVMLIKMLLKLLIFCEDFDEFVTWYEKFVLC